MKFNVRALASSLAIFWGAVMFLMTLSAMIWPGYGLAFRELTASFYPGYHGTATFRDLILGGVYGAIDGAAGGAIFAWLYNSFAARAASEAREPSAARPR
jgi:hypothetical protein